MGGIEQMADGPGHPLFEVTLDVCCLTSIGLMLALDPRKPLVG